MNEDILYNEPGYGDKKQKKFQNMNVGYSNIVRYANIKYAMIDAIKNPPAEFKDEILVHFYLLKDKIKKTCEKWLKEAKNTADYTGLVSSHNSKLASLFSSSANSYHDNLKL